MNLSEKVWMKKRSDARDIRCCEPGRRPAIIGSAWKFHASLLLIAFLLVPIVCRLSKHSWSVLNLGELAHIQHTTLETELCSVAIQTDRPAQFSTCKQHNGIVSEYLFPFMLPNASFPCHYSYKEEFNLPAGWVDEVELISYRAALVKHACYFDKRWTVDSFKTHCSKTIFINMHKLPTPFHVLLHSKHSCPVHSPSSNLDVHLIVTTTCHWFLGIFQISARFQSVSFSRHQSPFVSIYSGTWKQHCKAVRSDTRHND